MTSTADFKKSWEEVSTSYVNLFNVKDGQPDGLNDEGMNRLTELMDVTGLDNLTPDENRELDALLTFRKKSDRTPKEQVEYEKLVKERLRKRMILDLIKMQYMWIEMHRIPEEEIRSYDDSELHRQYQMHSKLWESYKSKPSAPDTCNGCGVEVGKCEVMTVVEGKTVYANDYCRECYQLG